jgi:hypothetical protein
VSTETEVALRAWLAHKNSAKPEGPPAAVFAYEIEEERLRDALSKAHLATLDASVRSLDVRLLPNTSIGGNTPIGTDKGDDHATQAIP